MKPQTRRNDLVLHDHGSVILFDALNKHAADWLHELGTESWQWMGGRTLAVDRRYAGGILTLAREAGLRVQIS